MNNTLLPPQQAQVSMDILFWLYKQWSINTYCILSSGNILFELYFDEKMLTIYVEKDGTVKILRIWGNGVADMDEPEYHRATRDNLLKWLEGIEIK